MNDTQWHVLLLTLLAVLAAIVAVAFHGFEKRLARLETQPRTVIKPEASPSSSGQWKKALPGHETTVFRRDSSA